MRSTVLRLPLQLVFPWVQCYKTFFFRNWRVFVINYGLCPWQTFSAKSNVCGEDQSLPNFKCSTFGQAPGLTHKHQTRMERPARDKHSSLLRTFGSIKFYSIWHLFIYNNFFGGCVPFGQKPFGRETFVQHGEVSSCGATTLSTTTYCTCNVRISPIRQTVT